MIWRARKNNSCEFLPLIQFFAARFAASLATCADVPRYCEKGEQMTELCMRTPAAALYLGIAESTLNKMRLTGYGPPFVKVGARAVAYRKADLDAWLQARVRRSTSDAPLSLP